LVCSLSADGFLIMASFDSNTVDKDTVQRVGSGAAAGCGLGCTSSATKAEGAKQTRIGHVQCLGEADRRELERLSKQVKKCSADSDVFEIEEDDVEAVWNCGWCQVSNAAMTRTTPCDSGHTSSGRPLCHLFRNKTYGLLIVTVYLYRRVIELNAELLDQSTGVESFFGCGVCEGQQLRLCCRGSHGRLLLGVRGSD
jgi:hypothetical protein